MSRMASTQASHTSGLNQCRHSAMYASGFIMWSQRLMCRRSWASTHSRSRSVSPCGKYMRGRTKPDTKAVSMRADTYTRESIWRESQSRTRRLR